MAESGKRTCPGDANYMLGADLGSEINHAGLQLADSSSSRLGADMTQHLARPVASQVCSAVEVHAEAGHGEEGMRGASSNFLCLGPDQMRVCGMGFQSNILAWMLGICLRSRDRRPL